MLTPSERRGVVVVFVLLVLGTVYDLWRARPSRKTSWLADAVPAAPVQDSLARRRAFAGPSVKREVQLPVVDLNRAGIAELDRLPGIGPVIAGRIVEHRDRHGNFQRVEDLLAVRGIGPRLLERLEGRLSVTR